MANRIKGLTVDVKGDSTKLTKAIKDATSDMKSFERSLKDINKSIKLDPTNIDLYNQKQKILNGTIEETAETLKTLQKYQDELDGKGAERSSEEYQKLILQIAECKKKIKDLKDEQTTLPASVQVFNYELEQTSKKLDDLSTKTQGWSRVWQAVGTASVKSAVAYENNIASIKKVIKDLADETVSDLKNIAVETGTAFDEISNYATIGATLGIAQEDIASFVQAMVDLQTATDGAIAGEDGAKAVARFLNVLQIGTDQAQNFGSAITFVGDQFAATGDEVLEVATQIAGISTIANVSQYDIIGLAAEMKNLGLRSASSASAITRSFMAIETEVSTNGKKLEDFAKASGMSAEEFSKAWKDDALNAFLRFTDGIKSNVFAEMNNAVNTGSKSVGEYAKALELTNNQFVELWKQKPDELFNKYVSSLEGLDDEAESSAVILKNVGLNGVRTAETLLKLAGNSNVVRKAVADANKAWNENNALSDKANTMYETTEAQYRGMVESLKQAGAEIATTMLPTVNSIVDVIKDLSKWLSTLSPEAKKVIANFILFNAALSPGLKTASKLTDTLKASIEFYGKYSGKVKQAGTDVAGAVKDFDVLGKTIGGVGKLASTALGSAGLTGAITLGVGALSYFAINASLANDEMYQATLSANNLTNAIKNNADAVNDNYVSYQTKLAFADTYVERIRDINRELQNENLTDGERLELQQKLEEYIKNVNDALGYEAFYFSTTNGVIDEQGNHIDNVKAKFQDLATEAKKSAWLNIHQEDYENALKVIEEAQKGKEALMKSLNSQMEEAGYAFEDIEKWSQIVKSGFISDSDMDKYSKLQDILSQYRGGMNALKEDQEIANKTISDYNKVLESTAETYDSVMSSLQQGELGSTLKELDDQLLDLQKQRDLLVAIGAEENGTLIDDLEKRIELIKETIKNTQDENNRINLENIKEETRQRIQARTEELQETERLRYEDLEKQKLGIDEVFAYGEEKDAKTAEGRRTELDEYTKVRKEKEDEAAEHLEKQMNNAWDSAKQYVADNPIPAQHVPIYFDYVNNSSPYFDSTGYSGNGGSGGYGDKVNKIAESISRTLSQSSRTSNKPYASGGFTTANASVTINVNNNGRDITPAQVRGWVNIINEELGKEL